MSKQNKDKPLTVEVKDDQLIIKVGIGTIAHCTMSEMGGPLNEKKVSLREGQELQWAKDISYEINMEDDGGNTPLYKFLDKMMIKASENGSAALEWK